MEICAVVRVEKELVVDLGGKRFSVPKEQVIGYAVFENGQMISQIFGSYAEAAKWMDQEIETCNCSGGISPK
jgi:hypothetical protein